MECKDTNGNTEVNTTDIERKIIKQVEVVGYVCVCCRLKECLCIFSLQTVNVSRHLYDLELKVLQASLKQVCLYNSL